MGITFTGGVILKQGSLKQHWNKPPTWITNSGDLGTLTSGTNLNDLNITLSATDSDGGPDNITYTIVRGSLPTGGSLNTNTGAITGPIVLDGTNEPVVFTVRASDGRDYMDREFSITVNEFVAPVGDEHWDNVVLLTPYDIDFNDKSNNSIIPTTVGTPILDGSGKFDSCVDLTNGMTLLNYMSVTDFKFDINDFTIEYWVKPDNGSQTNYRCHITSSPNVNISGGWFIGTDPNGSLYYAMGDNNWNFDISTTEKTVMEGQWSHIAVSRNNDIIKYYINGQMASSVDATGIKIENNSGICIIGGRNYNTQYSGARIDDVRITKGVGRYLNNFTPPTEQFQTS